MNKLVLLLCVLSLSACSLTRRVIYIERWDCEKLVVGNKDKVYRVSMMLPPEFTLERVVYGEGLFVDGEYYFVSPVDSSTVYVIGLQPGLEEAILDEGHKNQNKPEQTKKDSGSSEFRFRNIRYGYNNVSTERLNEMDELMQRVVIDSAAVSFFRLGQIEHRIESGLSGKKKQDYKQHAAEYGY